MALTPEQLRNYSNLLTHYEKLKEEITFLKDFELPPPYYHDNPTALQLQTQIEKEVGSKISLSFQLSNVKYSKYISNKDLSSNINFENYAKRLIEMLLVDLNNELDGYKNILKGIIDLDS